MKLDGNPIRNKLHKWVVCRVFRWHDIYIDVDKYGIKQKKCAECDRTLS